MRIRKKKIHKQKRFNSNEEPLKVGLLYRCIARNCFEKCYPEMSKHLVDEILIRGDIDEIESCVAVREKLKVVITVLDSILTKDNIKMAKDAFDVLLYSETPEYDLEEIMIEIGLRKYDLASKVEMNITLVSALHDNWVSLNSDKFFYETREDRRFMFMPLELVGFNEMLNNYLYVKDIAHLFDFGVDMVELEKGYYEARRSFMERNSLHDENDLTNYVMRADYNPLEQDIVCILRTDKEVARAVAKQIISRL